MGKNLDSLTVHAFRGLRELQLLQLGQINLFVGPNNSGKTSALEAVGLYSRPLDLLEWIKTARRREIKSSRAPQLEPVKWLFPRSPESETGHAAISVSGEGKF